MKQPEMICGAMQMPHRHIHRMPPFELKRITANEIGAGIGRELARKYAKDVKAHELPQSFYDGVTEYRLSLIVMSPEEYEAHKREILEDAGMTHRQLTDRIKQLEDTLAQVRENIKLAESLIRRNL